MSNNSHKVTEENTMIRRFERSEIILHWANAVPFLLLLITGALSILSHFVIISPAFLRAIRTAHKIGGVLWIAGMGCSFFLVGRKLNMANLRDHVCMGLSDIVWMFRALRSACNPNIKMPPAGKFNTGQKINAVLVMLYAVAFAGSGALMWVCNTMLLPWFFHVSVFLLAVASLGGHLYLSLLHPSTRPGLIGIFTGMVPRSYVLHHHSLTIGGAANTPAQATANGVFMKAEIVLLVLVLIGSGLGIEALGQLPRSDLKRGFESIISPGELSKAHSIQEIDGCTKCHEYTGELPDGKCLSCHKIIQARIEARSGYHGGIQDKCIHCHKEHPGPTGAIVNFETEKFDHAVAAFKLEGKHKDAKCEACHKRKATEDGNNPAGYYVGLRHDACLDCHKDVHTGGFGDKKCETCHSAAGWKEKDLKFDHNGARFPLEGKHTSVACDKCHKGRTPGAALGAAVFTGMKFGLCSDCHKDPHRGKLRAPCAACHSVQGWISKDLKFDHGRDAKFRLEGKHQSVTCVKCHRAKANNGPLDVTSFKTKHASCSNCHKDPHRGELKAGCGRCHSVQGWRDTALTFDHGRDTNYRLQGKHLSLPCVKCHRSAANNRSLDVTSFKISKSEMCLPCHKQRHLEKFAVTCERCHNFVSWKSISWKRE